MMTRDLMTREKQIELISKDDEDFERDYSFSKHDIYVWIVRERCKKYKREFEYAKSQGIDILHYEWLEENTHQSIHKGVTIEVLKKWGVDISLEENGIEIKFN